MNKQILYVLMINIKFVEFERFLRELVMLLVYILVYPKVYYAK